MALTKTNLANIVEGILPVANGGTGTSTGVSPGGSTTQVQYNSSGAFAGSANLTFDGTNLISGGYAQTGTFLKAKGTGTTGNDGVFIDFSAPNGRIASINSSGAPASNLYLATTTTGGTTTTALAIDYLQNVGIGTTSPAAKLDVNGNVFVRSSNNLYTNGIYAYDSDVNISTNSSGSQVIKLSTGAGAGTERMRITSAGDVGIGVAPYYSHKLAVNGSTVTQNLFINAAAGGDQTGFYNDGGTTSTSYALSITNSGGSYLLRAQYGGNLQFNSGYGSMATAYGCRAWVNFNGQGTVTIRGSGNVSSITDNGTGQYTVNLTSAMPDANYGINFGFKPDDVTFSGSVATRCMFINTQSTSSFQVLTGYQFPGGGSAYSDAPIVCCSVLR
jgi:hypothetical protein